VGADAAPAMAERGSGTPRSRHSRHRVITLAELRDGHIYAGWGEARRQRAEQLISAYLLVPMDMAIVNRFAETRAACRSSGVTVPDNDIWIAATAYTRGWPLVSCDGHFDLIEGCDHIRLPVTG